MKKHILTLILTLFAISFYSFSQNDASTISFEEKVHDFGEFQEADGVVSYKFEFTNKGAEPLIIQRVSASCGCTTPSWTKEPVLPGEKGFVSAAYNPAHRPGQFEKTITVYSNASDPIYQLKIKGKVTPEPLKPLENQ
jgi:Protein of unknown function (DUF1573)